MTELTHKHKKTLGETRHVVDTHGFWDDFAPPVATGEIRAVTAKLGPMPPVHVPLRQDDRAIYW